MNLAGVFAETVQKQGEKVALFWGDRTYSYAELWSQTLFVTGVLRQQYHVQPGDNVALFLKNCPEFIPSLFGILHGGAAAVPINNFLKPDELIYILKDAGVKVIITDSELIKILGPVKDAMPELQAVNVEEVLASFPVPPNNLKFE